MQETTGAEVSVSVASCIGSSTTASGNSGFFGAASSLKTAGAEVSVSSGARVSSGRSDSITAATALSGSSIEITASCSSIGTIGASDKMDGSSLVFSTGTSSSSPFNGDSVGNALGISSSSKSLFGASSTHERETEVSPDKTTS